MQLFPLYDLDSRGRDEGDAERGFGVENHMPLWPRLCVSVYPTFAVILLDRGRQGRRFAQI